MPKIEVAYDADRRLLRWTMRGFWSLSDVAASAAALRGALAPLGAPPYRVDGLCDASDFPVQAQEVSDALGEIDRIGSSMRVGRFAVVVGSMMNKLQAERALHSNRRTFFTMAEAEAWLATPDEGLS